MKLTPNRLVAYLMLVGNAFFWGIAFPIIKLGFLNGLTPLTFLLARFFFAVIFSLPIGIIAIKKNPPTFKQLITIVLLELLGTVVTLSLLYIGLNHTTSIEATLIAVTWPIFVTIGGIFIFKEKEEKNELIGLFIAIIGTILLVIEPVIRKGFNGALFGNILIFLQNISMAAYLLLAKKHYKKLNKWVTTHISFWIALLVFASYSLFVGHSPINQITTLFTQSARSPLIASLYMGIFGSVIGLTLYLKGQEKIEASEAAVFTYLQPLFAVPTAYLLLSEHIKTLEIIAIIIIILGVFLVEKRR